MRIVDVICKMSTVIHEGSSAVDSLAFNADAKQWINVGVEIGQLMQLGERLAELARLARVAAVEEEWSQRPGREEVDGG